MSDKPWVRNTTKAKDSWVVGAVAELSAANLFMNDGYHVYRSLSHTGTHDLIIVIGETIKTVQVTAGKKSKASGILYHKKSINKCKSDYLFIHNKECCVLIDVKSREYIYPKQEAIKQGALGGNRPMMIGAETLHALHKGGGGVSLDAWKDLFCATYKMSPGSRRTIFKRAKDGLVSAGHIRIVDKMVFLVGNELTYKHDECDSPVVSSENLSITPETTRDGMPVATT